MTKTAITKTAMTKTAAPLAALAGMLLCTLPAQAQGRVFVSGSGVDTNPCTYAAPCRSFQQLVGIWVSPSTNLTVITATLNRINANNNDHYGVATAGNDGSTTIANSVISNNGLTGLQNDVGTVWLAKSVIAGNSTGVVVSGTVNSYQDNFIGNNSTPVSGTLTNVSTQ